MRRDRLLRACLPLLAVAPLVVGAWALFAPRSFFEDFPAAGRRPTRLWASTTSTSCATWER